MATINELESFNINDAVSFHDELNPKLWDDDDHLDPTVRKQLLVIAENFAEYLGVKDLIIQDITFSGSNAAYSYTDHSDIDLHLVVDMFELPNNEIYRELFTAKKTLYNSDHSITIRRIPVELYVQDSNEPVVSLGEYSVLKDKWIKRPKKQRANFDQTATKDKFEHLASLVDLAVKTRSLKTVEKVLATIKRYRKAGLDKAGEFGPEALAFKAIRTQGGIQELFNLKNELLNRDLSIDESSKLLDKPTKQPEDLAKKYGVSKMQILAELDKGIKAEMEHTSKRDVAREIALDHIGEDLHYYEKLASVNLECMVNEVSGYIPSNAQKNDPRWSMALTKDVRPSSIKDNAFKMGLGKITRTGIPPTSTPNGKIQDK